MTNDAVCSHQVHRKSKLMFELYVLHLPNMCRHRQIKQSALILHPPLICCLWHFVCTCLIQKEGIYIISEKLYYWQEKLKYLALKNTPPPIQTSLWDQQHLWMSFAAEPFPPTQSPANSGAIIHSSGIPALYTEHVSGIFSLQERWNSCFSFKSLLDLAGWTVLFKKYFCIQHSTTAWYWYLIKAKYPVLKDLHFRADYNNSPQVVSEW